MLLCDRTSLPKTHPELLVADCSVPVVEWGGAAHPLTTEVGLANQMIPSEGHRELLKDGHLAYPIRAVLGTVAYSTEPHTLSPQVAH